MKNTIFTLALLAILFASCTKAELKEERPNTFTITASMPGNESNIKATTETRMAFEANGKGITTKWEAGDQLYVYFIQNGTSYMTEAPIVASSITPNGKQASFTVSLPASTTTFDNNAPFNLHFYYYNNSRVSSTSNYVAFFNTSYENYNTALSGERKFCPFLSYKHATQLEISDDLSAINFSLQHEGYVIALHIRNNSTSPQNLPIWFYLSPKAGNNEVYNWFGPGGRITNNYWHPATETWEFPPASGFYYMSFRLKKDASEVLLGANETHIVYRWAMGGEDAPELIGSASMESGGGGHIPVSGTLPATPGLLKKGKCIHVYLTYNGTNMAFVNN